MPTVSQYGPFRVKIIPGDHPPPHVHIEGPSCFAKIEIESGKVIKSARLDHPTLNRLSKFVVENKELYMEAWNEWTN